jgi:diguanylate cyclase (GGDEF)-like protein/PAS domain S-box-containing protein
MENFFVLDPDGAIIQTSPSLEILLGFEPGELRGKDISAFISWPLDDGKPLRQEILKQLQAQEIWCGTLDARKKDGTLFRAYAQIRPSVASGQSQWITTLRGLNEEEQGLDFSQDRMTLEKIVMNISTRFINLESSDAGREIQHALEAIGKSIGLDHGYIYLFNENRSRARQAYSWHAAAFQDRLQPAKDLLLDLFPRTTSQLLKGGVIALPPLGESNPPDGFEREILRSDRTESLILIPMLAGKKPVGFLGFESLKTSEPWPEETIGLLRMAGDIFTNAVERQRTTQELQRSEEKYRNLVENINDVIFSLDARGCITYISPVIEQVILYRPEEMIGHPLSRYIYLEDLPAFSQNLKQVLEGQVGSQEIRVLNREGSIRHVRISARRLMNGDQAAGLTGMLGDITEQKWAEVLLRRAEEKYRSIFENAVEGIFQSTLDGRFIVANPACARILGYSSSEELIVEHSAAERRYFLRPERFREFQQQLEEKGVIREFEAEVYRKDGSIIWISANALAIRDPMGVLIFYEGTIEDITERKRAEDQIRYLSFHDKLTDLYNRVYFEEELNRLDTERQLPISIIMGDVNGLKLVNDAFGHAAGDKLLNRVAQILRDCCRKEDVIARLGGDEFAIFLPRTGFKVTSIIIDRIKMACSNASQDPVQLSIALGAVTKESPSQDMQEILREAEERMYRSKLLESKSLRASIISSLKRTLFEKSHETEEHTNRLQRVALKIGHALGLSEGELNDLSLLSTLHDIGKIAIPEGIIVKPGQLSSEEWDLIWKHPEIGYRIAAATPELVPIAEAILAHHEWWDGSGYPRGLKGEEIPLLSRIISIVDAFDVMTFGRPYKERVTQEQALVELQKQAGIQFDPKLIEIFVKTERENTTAPSPAA